MGFEVANTEKIRERRDVEATKIADKFACFKRDFLGAPIWKAMNMVSEKKDGFTPCQIDYRSDESFWVFGTKSEVNVVFEINMADTTDQALCRIFLLELADSGRNVMNAQGINYHDKDMPLNVKEKFPKASKIRTSNGAVAFLVDDKALARENGIELPLS